MKSDEPEKREFRKSPKAKRAEKEAALALLLPPPVPEEAKLSIDELTQFAREHLSYVFNSAGIEHLANQSAIRQAKHLYTSNPSLYAEVVQALMSGLHPVATSVKFKVSCDVTRVLRKLYPEIVQAGRAQVIADLEEISLNLTNRLLKDGHRIPIAKVAGVLATVIEKTQLLTGGVTSRSEHLSAPKPEELTAMFEALPQVNATVIEPNATSQPDNHHHDHRGTGSSRPEGPNETERKLFARELASPGSTPRPDRD